MAEDDTILAIVVISLLAVTSIILSLVLFFVWRRFKVTKKPYAGPGPILEQRLISPSAETIEKWLIYKALESAFTRKND
jgi:hypothetical protein